MSRLIQEKNGSTWKRTDTVIPRQQSPMKRKPPIIRGLLPSRSMVKHCKTHNEAKIQCDHHHPHLFVLISNSPKPSDQLISKCKKAWYWHIQYIWIGCARTEQKQSKQSKQSKDRRDLWIQILGNCFQNLVLIILFQVDPLINLYHDPIWWGFIICWGK